jgi:hypothetical protein
VPLRTTISTTFLLTAQIPSQRSNHNAGALSLEHWGGSARLDGSENVWPHSNSQATIQDYPSDTDYHHSSGDGSMLPCVPAENVASDSKEMSGSMRHCKFEVLILPRNSP